jgi:hypothetical protein
MQVPTNFDDSFKFWITWKETAIKSLKARWSIEDTGILIAFFEQTILAGLCTPREADKQVKKVIKPTRLSLVSMTKYFQAQIVIAESREGLLRSFLIYDGLISYLERHYHPQAEQFFEDFHKVLPYLSEYKSELRSICDAYGRPYPLPDDIWIGYSSKQSSFSPIRPIMRHFMSRIPNLNPQTMSIVDYFRSSAQTALHHQRKRSRASKDHQLIPKLPLPHHQVDSALEQLETNLLESCSRYAILDHFLVLEGLTINLEDHWFIETLEVQRRFMRIRVHLLEVMSYDEVVDYIKVFKRPYQLHDD